ncbi:hypothetical protein [Nonomuraea sp. NPDC005501]
MIPPRASQETPAPTGLLAFQETPAPGDLRITKEISLLAPQETTIQETL